MVKTEVVVIAYLNLKIPYSEAEMLVSQWYERYSQYDYQTLAQWILAGDVSSVNGKLTLAPYVDSDDLNQLVVKMQGAGGIAIEDRRYNFKTYPKCFVGSEVVQWLMANVSLTQTEAIRVGQRMLQKGIIQHVVNEQDFKDDYLFYRFC
ncbi:MAG: hypothetical protein AAGF93_13155 [Cyanobacteria bacterium P01_H01_bin.105]